MQQKGKVSGVKQTNFHWRFFPFVAKRKKKKTKPISVNEGNVTTWMIKKSVRGGKKKLFYFNMITNDT